MRIANEYQLHDNNRPATSVAGLSGDFAEPACGEPVESASDELARVEPVEAVDGAKSIEWADRESTDFVVDQLLPIVPGTLDLMERGANFLLADCGGSDALRRIARQFRRSRFVGIDEQPWNVASAASRARAARIGNLWFHDDLPDEMEFPPVYHVVVSLDPGGRVPRDPHWIVRIAAAVRHDGVLFFENDNGTARATLLAMGFRKIREMRPEGAPSRRFIVAVR
ncbi:MAG TPA: hypothetical protein VMM36_18560 [Opitutaceae bacterium]|nr:hypothetical protein [Opitutaceae bacterium]